ncbi:MAG: hypothetical protein MN733_36280 [Nitrososphaera sp.]|nr:hypothetical protein [Nitrososphaera sp.]
MTEANTQKHLLIHLHSLVSGYLDGRVTKPSLETVDRDFFAQDHLVDMLLVVSLLVDIAHKEGTEFDKDFLHRLSKEEIEKRIDVLTNFVDKYRLQDATEIDPTEDALDYLVEDSSRKYLLPYLNREINWIVVSILSASYVSSLILMRAVFELVIGIASKSTGSMSDRIDSVACLSDKEKSGIKKLWYRLCAWGHPYGKWIKEICPVYADQEPIYHPKLCKLCLQELEEIVDLFAVVAMDRYEMETTRVVAKMQEAGIDSPNFRLLEKRLSA